MKMNSDGSVEGTPTEIRAWQAAAHNATHEKVVTTPTNQKTHNERKKKKDIIALADDYVRGMTSPEFLTIIAERVFGVRNSATYQDRIVECVRHDCKDVAVVLTLGHKRNFKIIVPLVWAKKILSSVTPTMPATTEKASRAFVPSRCKDAKDAFVNELASRLNGDGFVTAGTIKAIYLQTHKQTSNTMGVVHIAKEIREKKGIDVVAIQGRGICMKGFESACVKAQKAQWGMSTKKKGYKKRGGHVGTYQEFIRARLFPIMKAQHCDNQTAMKLCALEWSKLKAAQHEKQQKVAATPATPTTSPAPTTTTTSEVTRSALYYTIRRELNSAGCPDVSNAWLDGLGDCLRRNGKVMWDYRDLYMTEELWDDVVCKVLFKHLPELAIVWGVRKVVIQDYTLTAR
jgi:hypothetical protein